MFFPYTFILLIPLIPDQKYETFDQVEGQILIQYFLIPLYSLYPLYQKEIWRYWQRSWLHNNLFFPYTLILKIPLIPDEKYEDLNKSMTKYKSNISLYPYTRYTPYTRSKIWSFWSSRQPDTNLIFPYTLILLIPLIPEGNLKILAKVMAT